MAGCLLERSYYHLLDGRSAVLGSDRVVVPVNLEKWLAIDPWPAPGVHWRNMHVLPAEGEGGGMLVEVPVSTILLDGRWTSSRAYSWPYIVKKYMPERVWFGH